jgi:hypothetical protein
LNVLDDTIGNGPKKAQPGIVPLIWHSAAVMVVIFIKLSHFIEGSIFINNA